MADFMQRACAWLGASEQRGIRAISFLRYQMKEGINDIKVRGQQTGEMFDPPLESGFWFPSVRALAHSSLCSAAKASVTVAAWFPFFFSSEKQARRPSSPAKYCRVAVLAKNSNV